MEELLIKSLPNLGVGLGALVVLYLSYRDSMRALGERDQAFRHYVEANNHKSVEVMAESRDAIKAAAKSIEKNTEVIEKLILRKD